VKFHLNYCRDGGPVACNCVINHDHDVDALTLTEANDRIDKLIKKFRDDIGFVAPECYFEKFNELSEQCKSIIAQVG
jgi:hypothetical protein